MKRFTNICLLVSFVVLITNNIVLYVSNFKTMTTKLVPPSIDFEADRGSGQYNNKRDKTFVVESFSLVDSNWKLNGFYRKGDESVTHFDQGQTFSVHLEGLSSDLIGKLKPHLVRDRMLSKVQFTDENYFKVDRKVNVCNCNSIIRGNVTESKLAKTLTRPKENTFTSEDIIKKAKNCSKLIQERGYITDSLTEVEEHFPIAFSILVYKAFEQSERLLRAIYRPQNVYCIHVDNKTDPIIFSALNAIAGCFDNVFMSKVRFDVKWGKMTVLEPDVHCMLELFKRSKTWKYFINLTGQEFPLKTNYEMVQILKAYNGSNDIEGTLISALNAIAGCFDNVFMSKVRFDVKWGKMTVLEPDVHCMLELFKRSKTWKYFINLTGQEFPLKTNYEMVQILKAYNGSNDIEGTLIRSNPSRWQKAGTPPHNITAVKGSVHIVASRGFVEFALHDQRAKHLYEWSRHVDIPDEVFFSSLQHNPQLGVPGSYKGVPETFSVDSTLEKPFLARYKNWGDGIYDYKCHGKRVRGICIVSVGDLPLLARRKELFVNKIIYDYEPMAHDCLEEWHFNKTRDIYLGKWSFDPQEYGSLGFVKNKVQ